MESQGNPASWALLACTEQPISKVLSFPDCGRNHWIPAISLEVENDACGNAQIVLVLCSLREFIEMGQQVVDLDRPQREVLRYFKIHAAADGHRKRIV